MKYKIYFPDENTCQWLECIKKGYERFGGFCSSHRVQGKELGNNQQCSFYDKNGYCLQLTTQQFNKRFYCDNHLKLLTDYDKEVKEQIEILKEEERKGKIIELVGVLEKYVSSSTNINHAV